MSLKTTQAAWAAFCCVMLFVSCSKHDSGPATPTPTPTPAPSPSGDIATFSARDSLIGFNNQTFIKWLVTNDNAYTTVMINNVKVALYGDMSTGQLKQSSAYTIMLNNNKTASLTVKVADSVTTLLWNKGKRLKQTKLEYYYQPPGDSMQRWVDTPINKQIADQRTYFALNNRTSTIQLSSMYVAPPDAYFTVTDVAKLNFIWNGVLYIITTLTSDDLVITYGLNTSIGYIRARNTYKYE